MATTYVDEFRGVDNLVCAEVLVDDNDTGYVCGDVMQLAPVAEISKTTETANDTKYYDNRPALVIQGEGSDSITLTVSALSLATVAALTGKDIDSTTGALMDGEGAVKYYALGYRMKLVGDKPGYRYVWRYKGRFNVPDETSATEDAGTDSNNQSLVYTGIMTNHVFTKPNKPQRALVVDSTDGKADVTTFFDEVTTIDTLTAATTYTLTITEAGGTTVIVTRNGSSLASGATLYAGDVLTIYVTGGTVTVNGSAFTSGGTHTVSAAVTVVSTAGE